MPDAHQILMFMLQVLETPIALVGTFVGALALTLFVIDKVKEMVR